MSGKKQLVLLVDFKLFEKFKDTAKIKKRSMTSIVSQLMEEWILDAEDEIRVVREYEMANSVTRDCNDDF